MAHPATLAWIDHLCQRFSQARPLLNRAEQHLLASSWAHLLDDSSNRQK